MSLPGERDTASLRVLQQRLQQYLLGRGDPPYDRVLGTGRLSAGERLDIYADAYRTRLIEALAVDFPALQTLLGEQAFRIMGRAYADARPSRHFSIRWFGCRLSAFLAGTPPYAKQPVLAEMAAFEWALSEALDAAGAPRLGFEDLVAIPPEDWPGLGFRLHPSLRRLDLHWNVPALWKAIDEAAAPQAPQREAAARPWVIWRKELASWFYSLDAAEAWALDAVLQGRSFAELCEGLCRWHPEERVAAQAARLLRGWLDNGMISALD